MGLAGEMLENLLGNGALFHKESRMVSPAIIASATGGFTPHSYRGLALDIDPAQSSLLRFAYACEFANDSHYLATAAAINFGLHQRFTIELWRTAKRTKRARWPWATGTVSKGLTVLT